MGLGVDRTVRRRGEEGGRPFVLFLYVANVYANIAKTVRWAQLLKDLDVSATEKGKVRILALALEPGKSMDHVGMGTWRLINDWAGRPTGLVFSTEKGREGWSLRMSDQPVCVIPRTPIFFFFRFSFSQFELHLRWKLECFLYMKGRSYYPILLWYMVKVCTFPYHQHTLTTHSLTLLLTSPPLLLSILFKSIGLPVCHTSILA